MTRRRFFAPPGAFNSKTKTAMLAADEARHLREVLRLKVGDEIFVFNGAGQEFHCRIDDSRREVANLTIIEEVNPAKPESTLELTLAVALLKGEKFDLVVQKATELGVTRIVPVITKLADIRLRDESDATKRVTRWQRIALEAAKQCGRALVPEVTHPVAVDSFIKEANMQDSLCLLFSERDGGSLREAIEFSGQGLTKLTALVGSEGGWTDSELELAQQNGWKVVTLGGRTLRAETAAIAIVTLLQHRAGDLV